MLEKTEGRRRRGWQRMRWLDGSIDLMDMSLSRLWGMVKGKQAWCVAVHGVTRSWTWLSNWTKSCPHDAFRSNSSCYLTFLGFCPVSPMRCTCLHTSFSLCLPGALTVLCLLQKLTRLFLRKWRLHSCMIKEHWLAWCKSKQHFELQVQK